MTKLKKENTTIVRTKSGTKIYVHGNPNNQVQRDRAGDQFVNYYNRNFTKKEQLQIGNIWYDMFNKDHNATQSPPAKPNDWIAFTGTFTGIDARTLNKRKKMVDLYINPHARNDEQAATHEMIHAKKFMTGVTQHNERKVDFEAIGRISRKAINNMRYGYYFSKSEGNPYLAKKRDLTYNQRDTIMHNGVKSDKILLTGSLSKNIIGKPVEKQVNKKFKKSFFFKRKF
jgi:hypothetical protein